MVGEEGGGKMIKGYKRFLNKKLHEGAEHGFKPIFMPDFLFDFQRHLVEWSVQKGRAAIFADCGMGKTPMQLVWAENIARKTSKHVLILTPLAVAQQTVREAEKFGIECMRSSDGSLPAKIVVTNYERLHYFNKSDFAGVVCDESSILKSFDGATRGAVTDFMRKIPYRLLCTATAAPNDYIELGTSSEALGELGYIDMLGKFFKNDQNTVKPRTYRHHGQNVNQLDDRAKWRFKGHAEDNFWRWVSSWARAIRRPSDFGFKDGDFVLKELIENEHVVKARTLAEGALFSLPAVGLQEQREERRRTIKERCEKVAELVQTKKPVVVWCHLNAEGDLLEKMIPDAVQISGKDSDDSKEEKFNAFQKKKIRVLVTKPKIGAWGLNWQHCSHMTFFPSHSYEQYYQGVRRCWRFGQKRKVVVDIVTTEGEQDVRKNLQRKAEAADKMFLSLVKHMNNALEIKRSDYSNGKVQVPSWLKMNS